MGLREKNMRPLSDRIRRKVERDGRLRGPLLRWSSLFRRRPGTDRQTNADLVVSMTSYPPRFPTLHLCLETLLSQSLRPARLLLWIAEEDIAQLPRSVARLQRRGLEVRVCRNLRSYKKIVPARKEFPDAVIVTADDDLLYPRDWLLSLYQASQEFPGEICCHRARMITFDAQGHLHNYRFWPNLWVEAAGLEVFPVGAGGILYPPNSLDERELFDESVFMNIAANADDVWLKAMSVLTGIPCRRLKTYSSPFPFLRGSQKSALMTGNLAGENDSQVSAVFSRFGVIDRIRKAPKSGA